MKKIFVFVIVTLFSVSLFAQDPSTFVKVGDDAPDFTITMEDGSTKKLSDLKGKVVWINFFATWCPPCVEEIPVLVDLAHVDPPHLFAGFAALVVSVSSPVVCCRADNG